MKRFIAGLAVFAVSLVGATPVFADSVAPTEFLSSSPLQISKYKRNADGTQLQFVQLFNNGDVPLDLNQWSVAVNVPGGQDILPNNVHGYLLPNEHVVVSSPAAVAGATLEMQSVVAGSITQLVVEPPAGYGYVADIYVLKASTVKNETNQNVPVYNEVWKRSMTTTGYSSSLTSFNVAAETQHFDDGLYVAPDAPSVRIVEIYPYASDCAPNDSSTLCGDYIKLYNPTASEVFLDDIVLRTDSSSASSTSSNTFTLSGKSISADGYLTVWLNDDGAKISLTNSGGYIWLDDAWDADAQPYGETMTHYESAGSSQQGYAWAEDEAGVWRWTSAPNPVGANTFLVETVAAAVTTDLAACPAGKYRNPETNRCRTIEEAVNELAACEEGKERNPATNRCRLVASTASAILTPCDEGQERNPATNRCRKVQDDNAGLTPCQSGYERNPATNRCRKIVGSSAVSTPAAAVESSSGSTLTTALLVTAGLGAAGYGLYEWRSEIGRATRRAWSFISRK